MMTDYKLDGDVLTINDYLEINVPVSIDCNDCDAVVVKALWSIVQKQQARIDELERWIAAIADDHSQIPDWIQQSARIVLAGGAK